MPAYRAYRPVLCRHTVRTGRYAVIGCKLKQNANEGCNSCATVVQALQDLFYVLLHVLFYLVSLLKPHDHRDWKYTRTVAYVTKLKYQIERSCMICVSVQYLPVVVKTISYFFEYWFSVPTLDTLYIASCWVSLEADFMKVKLRSINTYWNLTVTLRNSCLLAGQSVLRIIR